MALIKCPECGNSVSDMADKCIHCGFPIYMKVSRSTEKKKCSYCGTYSTIYEDVCSSCGARFEETATEQSIDMAAFEDLMNFDKMKNLMGFDEMQELLEDTLEELANMDIPKTSTVTKKTVNIDIVDDTMNVTMQVESQDGKTSETRNYQSQEVEKTQSEEMQSYQSPVDEPKLKNKWIALVLCYFLGFFGVHKFYEGNKKAGKLYLFTFGLLGVGWFYDMISYLFKPETWYNPNKPSEKEKKRKPLVIIAMILVLSMGAFLNEEGEKNAEEGTETSVQIENEVMT